MTNEDLHRIETRLAAVVFSLLWYDERGIEATGTGFFIARDGTALTAFHNLSPELLNDPNETLTGRFGETTVEFRWIAQGDQDREWQRHNDLAILRAVSVPEGIKPLNCYFLAGKIRELHTGVWAGDEVALLGHPSEKGFAPNLITGHVDRAFPVRDHNIDIGSGQHSRISAIQFDADFPGQLTGLRGISGSPLYDKKYGGIVGIAVGVQAQVAVSPLWPVAECWPGGRDLIQTLPVALPAGSLRLWLWLIPLIAIGLAWWRLRPPKPAPVQTPKQLAVEVLRLDSSRSEKLTNVTTFTEGERVRFLITPPAAGFLYVVDQELSRQGESGPAELIFPTARTGMGRNRVSAGVRIPFPAEDDQPPYLQPKPTDGNPDYGGELLTVLVYANPLKLDLKPDPLLLSPDQFPLDGGRPRLFEQPSSQSTDALAIQRIRVSVARTPR